MEPRIKIEIRGKDEFWTRAFHVEWTDQFSDRVLTEGDDGYFVADAAWLDDLDRVAEQTFCRVVRAPANPPRRQWMRSIFGKG